MPISFTRHEASRPDRYRTPSPPRSAVEPRSPVAPAFLVMEAAVRQSPQHVLENHIGALRPAERTAQRVGHRSSGSMEIFADIALSMQPKSPDRPNDMTLKRPLAAPDDALPACKRSRSGKLASAELSPDQSTTKIRPATSYGQMPQDRMLEAQLLLDFFHSTQQTCAPPNVSEGQCPRSASPIREEPSPKISSLSAFHCQPKAAISSTDMSQNGEAGIIEDSKQPLDSSDNTIPPQSQGCASLGPVTPTFGTNLLSGMDTMPYTAPTNDQEKASAKETNSVLDYNGGTDPLASSTGNMDWNLNANSSQPIPRAPAELGDREAHAVNDASEIAVDTGGDLSVTIPTAAFSHARRDVAEESLTKVLPMPVTETDKTGDKVGSAAFCAACKFQRNSSSVEGDNNATSWINCDGCKSWFHFACAGFKNEREVRAVDKYRCKKCKPIHGATTYVRKSSRAHSAIDYAGLHQGVIKTSDERMEHHYIQPIKDGVITFLPENFPRMSPELVTADFFEKSGGMKEPVVVPAILNPRPAMNFTSSPMENSHPANSAKPNDAEDSFDWDSDNHFVPNDGQDALDMVIPQGLTVRQVAELYGPEEKVEVIDVKSQNGENKKWNMRRWAEYYENPNNKVVRNVISLEVSQSKLGRLIRRPKIVRDLDLQDSVWPEDMLAKGEFPRVQFYCLMSVADCFTDFHIDFGGSSVFYHILKGKKTFLFIPPKEKHLKKYEEWCMSPAQNWTFLADQTKECYRVDLSEGDTMLIPSGWIHAVWTPEDSLVIGGNFLTRMNFGMQLRIAQVEKATGVARKFRYPHFQKLHWYTAFRYMEEDPLPEDLKDEFHQGQIFQREQPVYYEFDMWGENSRAGKRNYNARYYSQGEIEGLRELTMYLLRTVLIDLGQITEGITTEIRNAVRKSIPRGHGEPLDLIKQFATWCAWKRGNEVLTHWAYPDSRLEDSLPPEKLSAVTLKKLDREAALEAALQAPRRQSTRRPSSQGAASVHSPSEATKSRDLKFSTSSDQSDPTRDNDALDRDLATPLGEINRMHGLPCGAGAGSNRKTACEACRKRRRACKHKDQVEAYSANQTFHKTTSPTSSKPLSNVASGAAYTLSDPNIDPAILAVPPTSEDKQHKDWSHPSSQRVQSPNDQANARSVQEQSSGFEMVSGSIGPPRPRTKACNECRKSKRRCVHDAYGNEDPIKVAEQAIPRPHARKTHKAVDSQTPPRLSTDEQKRVEEPAKMVAPVANMLGSVADMIAAPQALAQQHPVLQNNSPDGDEEVSIGLEMVKNTAFADSTDMPAPGSKDRDGSQPDSIKSPPQQRREGPDDETSTLDGATLEDLPASASRQPLPSSSLISPPASSNDDLGSSPINISVTYSPSPSPSKQLPLQSTKEAHQRHTPDSGTLRRASSSSFEPQRNYDGLDRADELPLTAPPQDLGVKPSVPADTESLRLIKELQAQDYGLRRRGKT